MNAALYTAQRRAPRLALAALALASLVAAAVPRPASAAVTNVTTPLQLNATELHATTTSGEVGSNDEPYVIVFSADLSQPGLVTLTKRAGYFTMKSGDTVNLTLQAWSPSGGKAPIADTDNMLVLAALMEHDNNADLDLVRNNVDSRLRSALAANRTLSHASLVSTLRAKMDAALDEAAAQQVGNNDDRFGGTQSVEITPGNVLDASNGIAVKLPSLHFTDGNKANYKLTFTLKR